MTTKLCPPGKILNPKTNRCVNIDGAIGKKLLSSVKTKSKSPSPKLRSLLDHHDIGPLIAKNLDIKDAISLYNSKKHKDFITINTPDIPKSFTPFWHIYRENARWIMSITNPSFIITFGEKLGRNAPPGLTQLMVLVKNNKTFTRLFIDLTTKTTSIYEFYTNKSDIANGKQEITELLKDIFGKIICKESNDIINLSTIKPKKETLYQYVIPEEFKSSSPKDLKVKFNKTDGLYKYKFDNFTATLSFGGHKSNNDIQYFTIDLNIHIPKENSDINLIDTFGIINTKTLTDKDISSYWSKAYNVFNTLLTNLTLADKKMILKTGFGEYTNDEEDLFKNVTLLKYPVFLHKSA
jgi:hypothetical protein